MTLKFSNFKFNKENSFTKEFSLQHFDSVLSGIGGYVSKLYPDSGQIIISGATLLGMVHEFMGKYRLFKKIGYDTKKSIFGATMSSLLRCGRNSSIAYGIKENDPNSFLPTISYEGVRSGLTYLLNDNLEKKINENNN